MSSKKSKSIDSRHNDEADSEFKTWQTNYENETKRDPSKDHWVAPEGISIKPLYTTEDLPKGYDSMPGQFPFRRGPYASMYKGRYWTLRQYAGFSSAEKSNEFYRKNLRQGQRGLSVAFDLATHRGYDSDHPLAEDDVGMAGVAIDSVEDMKRLFDRIPLQSISVSMTMNGAVLPIMACYIVAAEEQGVKQKDLAGTIQNDILKEFMVRNTYIYPPEPSMRITSDIIAYTAKNMPQFYAISISGYHIQEAGATAVQEIAFTLADAMEYVRSASRCGLSLDEFAPRLSFFFGIGINFFMEVAKLRAARQLWAEIMRNTFQATSTRSMQMRMHCQTSGVSLTAQDPYNNVVRTTIEAMAGVLGGIQSLHTNALDEAVALPTDFSARIARNTQLILQEESEITKVIDPLGGSYYVERLTSELIERARVEIDKIEAMGGMVKAISNGYPKLEIEKIATARQAKVDKGQTPIIGVNQYPSPQDESIETLRIDNVAVRRQQCEKLAILRKERDGPACDAALEDLYQAAMNPGQSLLQKAIEAARKRATVGEISSTLEKAYGRYRQNPQYVSGVYDEIYRGSKDYQAVKQRIKHFLRDYDRQPKIYIAKIGQDGHDRGARVVASAFSDIGFAVVIGELFQSPEEAVASAIKENVDILGVSTLAGSHRTLVPRILEGIKNSSHPHIGVIVGGVLPSEDAVALKEAGVLAVYGPGTAIPQAAQEITVHIRNQYQHNRPRVL